MCLSCLSRYAGARRGLSVTGSIARVNGPLERRTWEGSSLGWLITLFDSMQGSVGIGFDLDKQKDQGLAWHRGIHHRKGIGIIALRGMALHGHWVASSFLLVLVCLWV